MRSLLLILCFFVLVHIQAVGQENEILWPPDTEALFASGVDVLSVELHESPIQSFTDNERRIVRIYDESKGEWQEYGYPQDSGGNYSVIRRSDDTYLLTAYSPYANWVIDPPENTVTPLELVCGDKTPALAGEGEWHYIANGEVERAYLCFTETDERIALPDEISNYDLEFVDDPIISPDNNWLVALAAVSEHVDEWEFYFFDVYSYEIATGRLNYLGRLDEDRMASFPPQISRKWVSNSLGLIAYGPPQESAVKRYYGFDVSQPDSLQLIFEGWLYDFYSHPPRYEYLSTTGFLRWKTGFYVLPEQGGCSFWRYDANGVQQHELGYDCIGAYALGGANSLTTLIVDGEPAEFSTLVTYDLTTREFTEIVSGEIEWLLDGALMLMDDSGQIDLVNYYPMYGQYADTLGAWWLGPDVEGAYIALFDVLTGEFLYDSSATHRVSSDGTVFSQWMADDRFVYSLAQRKGGLTLVVLGEDGAQEYTIEGISPGLNSGLQLAPGGYRMLVYMTQESTAGIADFLSGEAYPLLQPGVTADYDFFFEWLSGSTLRVRVSQNDYYGSPVAVYTVQIP